jgi:nitrogen fixation/metabolism regulation signal transduction histidine kinase
MTLRAKIIVYLVAIHLALGAVAFIVLREHPRWLLAAEVFFAVSIALGVLLVRALFVPLQLIRTGTDLIQERDFTTRFREVGQPEMDELIRIYNRLVDQLRQERLRLEERTLFLDRILNASPTGVVLLDLDGGIDYLNPRAEEMLAIGSDEARERKLGDLPGPVAGAMAGLEEGKARVLTYQGSRRLRCTRSSYLETGFRRTFFLLEELTEELRASERGAYHKLIRMMSHEVNNSVAAVGSLLETCGQYEAQLASENREDFRQALDVSISRMRHLNDFMNSFAEVVRLPPPSRRPCNLVDLVEGIHRLVQPELERRRIAWEWRASEPLPRVSLDGNQMEQVLVNVVRNAVEAIGEDGRIAVGIERRDGQPFLYVRDSGDGVPAEAQETLFTPFFSTKRDGRGLGLTVTQEILAQHGLTFGLRNRPEGGAEFWIGLGSEASRA